MAHRFYCIICNQEKIEDSCKKSLKYVPSKVTKKSIVSKTNLSKRFGNGMGVRSGLTIVSGAYHEAYAVKDLYHCKSCCNKFNGFDQTLLTDFFNDCEILILKFPVCDLDEIKRSKRDQNFNFFDLITLYDKWKKTGLPAFKYMVERVEKSSECVLSCVLSGELCTVIKLEGDNRFGEYRFLRLGPLDPTGEPTVILTDPLSISSTEFVISESRIYRYDYELKCMTSLLYQQQDESLARQLRQKTSSMKLKTQMIKQLNADMVESKRKEAISSIQAEMAYKNGLDEACGLYKENELLQVAVAAANKACAEHLISLAKKEDALNEKQRELCKQADELSTALTLNAIQYQRGQAGFEEHRQCAEQQKLKSSELEAQNNQLQETLASQVACNNVQQDKLRTLKDTLDMTIDELNMETIKKNMAYSKGQEGYQVHAQNANEAAAKLHSLEENYFEVQNELSRLEQNNVDMKRKMDTMTRGINRMKANNSPVIVPHVHPYKTRAAANDVIDVTQEDEPFKKQILARHMSSAEHFNETVEPMSLLSKFEVILDKALLEYEHQKVLTLIESKIPISFWIFVGMMFKVNLLILITLILNGDIDIQQSWESLWENIFPGCIILFMYHATANYSELHGVSGAIHDRLQLTRSVSLVSNMMNMLNNRCNQLVHLPAGLLFSRGKKIDTHMYDILSSLGITTSESTLQKYKDKMTIKSDEWILSHLSLLMRAGCVIVVAFDNVDFNGKAFANQIHWCHVKIFVQPPSSGWLLETGTTSFHHITTKPLSEVTHEDYNLNDDERKAISQEYISLCNSVLIVTNYEEQNKAVQLIVDECSDLIANNAKIKSEVKPLGRPKNKLSPTSEATTGDDAFTPSPKKSKPEHYALRPLASDPERGSQVAELTKQLADVVVSFDSDSAGMDNRDGKKESVPVSVCEGESVEILGRFPGRNIAMIKKSDLECGIIPLECITGNRAHRPIKEYLVTPLKERAKNHQRSTAVEMLTDDSPLEPKQLRFDDDDEEETEDNGNSDDDDCGMKDDDNDVIIEDYNGDSDDDDDDYDCIGDEGNYEDGEKPKTISPMPSSDSFFNNKYNKSFIESSYYNIDLVREVYENCMKHDNACSTNPLSFLDLLTHDGVASNLNDVTEMLKIIESLLFKANGNKTYNISFLLSDTQEFALIHGNRDKRRAVIVKQIKVLKKWHSNTLSSPEYIAELRSLKEKLAAIDNEKAYFLGLFHGVMGAIRGWCRLFGKSILEPFLAWTTYKNAYDGISTCAYGYHKLCIKVLSSILTSHMVEGVRAYNMMEGVDMDKTVDEKLNHCALVSSSFKFYDVAIRTELVKVLNLEASSRLVGLDCIHLFNASIKQIIPFYAISGNCNLVYAAAIHYRQYLIGPLEQVNAFHCNPTFFNVLTHTAMHYDKGMEEQGILPLKGSVGSTPQLFNFGKKAKEANWKNGKEQEFKNKIKEQKFKDYVNCDLDPKSRFNNDPDDSDIVNQGCACWRMNLRHHVIDEADGHVHVSDVPKYDMIVGLSPPNTPSKYVYILKDYCDRLLADQDLRTISVLNNVLSEAIGGKYKHENRKKWRAFVCEPPNETKSLVSLRSSEKKVRVFFALTLGKGLPIDEGMSAMVVDQMLRHGNKSKLRSVFFDLFSCENSVSGYIIHPTIPSSIQRLEGQVRTNFNQVIWDGNFMIRKSLNSPKYSTWEEAVLSFMLGIFKPYIESHDKYGQGILMMWFVLDVGHCWQKKIEDNRRLAAKPKSDKLLPEVDHSKHTFSDGSYLLHLYTQNRRGFQKLIGDTFSNEGFERNKNHPFWTFISNNPKVNFGFAGVGNTFDDLCRSRKFDRSTSQFVIAEWTHHLEDTKLAYLAIKAMLVGQMVVVIGNDTDLWLIIALAISKYVRVDTHGTIFVKTTDKSLGDSDVDSCLINCNAVAETIENDSRFEFVSFHMRVPYFVTLCIFSGGDTTNSWVKLSIKVFLTIAMAHLPLIGHLVRLPNPNPTDVPVPDLDGMELIVDKDCFTRLKMILFAMINPTAMCKNFGSLTIPEKTRLLADMGYADMEIRIAAHTLDTSRFMASLANLRGGVWGRVMSRGNTWYSSDQMEVSVRKSLGFTLKFPNASDEVVTVAEPRTDEFKLEDVLTSKPTFTTDSEGRDVNSTLAYLFGSNKEAGNAFIAGVRGASVGVGGGGGGNKIKYCGTCFHHLHGKQKCSLCDSDVENQCCIARCKQCLHPPHPGEVCELCTNLRKDNRSKCVPFCRECNHIGKTSDHLMRGCSECNANGGCCKKEPAVGQAEADGGVYDEINGSNDSTSTRTQPLMNERYNETAAAEAEDDDEEEEEGDIFNNFDSLCQQLTREQVSEMADEINGVSHDDELISFQTNEVDDINEEDESTYVHQHRTRYRRKN